MTGVVQNSSRANVPTPFLRDGRIFYPVFEDGGESYSRLIEAVQHESPVDELQRLAEKLVKENEGLTERMSSRVAPQTLRIPQIRYLKLRAAALLLRDLVQQGWIIQVEHGQITLYSPTAQKEVDPVVAKEIARRVGLFAKEDQLKDPTVRRFINTLESPGRGSAAIPITNLIADGRTLREKLEPIARLPKAERGAALGQVIQPYLQLVEPDKRCELTGIKYADIWRYFRFNWSFPLNSSPGRNIFFLIRDAGQPYHPVMGIAALGNTVMQLTCRDRLLGWLPDGLVDLVETGTITAAEGVQCLKNCIRKSLDEIYVKDLPLTKEELENPTPQTLSRLIAFRDDAALQRKQELEQKEKPKRIEFGQDVTEEELLQATQTSLYKFKRTKSVAELLRARLLLNSRTIPDQPSETLKELMADEEGRIAVGIALRQARNRLSGSAMMEIVVCGGVPPYSYLLSGKLACLMMLSPEVTQIYEERYSQQVSIIASQMAGRPIRRPAKLVSLGTTSLYAAGSSQYNRVFLPARTLSTQETEIRYRYIGHTEGYGSAHLSKETRDTLNALENLERKYRRVNNVFGEGANPKMRQLSSGLDALGIAQADLLRHASPRIVYNIPLIQNVERFLLEIDEVAEFVISPNELEGGWESSQRIANFWLKRWASSRLDHSPLFKQLGEASPLKLRVSRQLPKINSPITQLELPFLDFDFHQEDAMQAPVDEKLEYIRRLYRDESAFADNVKISRLRDIHIPTAIEKVIQSIVKIGGSVVLTGNAGDGKTHLIRLIEQKLKNQDTYIVFDASAEKLDEVLQNWAECLENGKSSCIAINEGPLLDLIKRHRKAYPFLEDVEKQLRCTIEYVLLDSKNADLSRINWVPPLDAGKQIFVIDLSLRQNLSRQMVSAVLSKLTEPRWYEGCKVCPGQASCGVAYNRQALAQPRTQERIGKLLEGVSIRGEQITFRELLAFCSYAIFGARSCDEMIELGGSEAARYYNHIFEYGDGKLFDELRKGFDPVTRTHPIVDEKFWRGIFSPDEFPLEPKPTHISLDGHSSNNSEHALDAFKSLKRRWFFEHPDGENLTPRTDSENFLEKLRDVNHTTQSRVSDLLRLLNRFLYTGDKDYPDYLRLWTRLAFSPKNKSKGMVCGRQVSSQELFLHEPRLSPLLEKCFGDQPVDHLLLGPEGSELRFANLRIDLRLLNLLLSPYGGTTEDPECTRRIYRFNDSLANQVKTDGGDFRIVSMVEGRAGREVRIRVDLRKRRYDGLDSERK
ncbi:hypothetical protein C7B76_27860 [filamentous cyanobacterium CCP2]|nr:hypothetical protein C7B76_27860 [filamentous cyanobacterium CCP2]